MKERFSALALAGLTVPAMAQPQVEAGAWESPDNGSGNGIRRLGFSNGSEAHYVLFMSCRTGEGWVSITQNEARRPDRSMTIEIGGFTINPPTRSGDEGVYGDWTEAMLPADHPVFIGMSRGAPLVVNGRAYPVATFAEQRRVAAFSADCDEG
jgi:hypothetical protein